MLPLHQSPGARVRVAADRIFPSVSNRNICSYAHPGRATRGQSRAQGIASHDRSRCSLSRNRGGRGGRDQGRDPRHRDAAPPTEGQPRPRGRLQFRLGGCLFRSTGPGASISGPLNSSHGTARSREASRVNCSAASSTPMAAGPQTVSGPSFRVAASRFTSIRVTSSPTCRRTFGGSSVTTAAARDSVDAVQLAEHLGLA